MLDATKIEMVSKSLNLFVYLFSLFLIICRCVCLQVDMYILLLEEARIMGFPGAGVTDRGEPLDLCVFWGWGGESADSQLPHNSSCRDLIPSSHTCAHSHTQTHKYT